jgi:hypothetical protein
MGGEPAFAILDDGLRGHLATSIHPACGRPATLDGGTSARAYTATVTPWYGPG